MTWSFSYFDDFESVASAQRLSPIAFVNCIIFLRDALSVFSGRFP
jgi:hypothetical protein